MDNLGNLSQKVVNWKNMTDCEDLIIESSEDTQKLERTKSKEIYSPNSLRVIKKKMVLNQ